MFALVEANIMPLTDVQIRTAKPRDNRTVKLSDGGGLQLWATPTGSKLWRLAYRFEGSQQKLSIGVYPAIGLRDAREARESAKRLLASGVDPGRHKRAEANAKANARANTFAVVADELLEKFRTEERSPATLAKAEWLLGLAKAELGPLPIADVTAPEILAVLEPVQARGHHETAKRLRGVISQVFRLAVAKGKATTDPTFALRGALVTVKATPRAAIVDATGFGGLLRAIDGYSGSLEVRFALQLLALTFVRPGELRGAAWSEFDLARAVWSIPAGRMKQRRPHFVPLARQAVDILETLRGFGGRGPLLFHALGGSSRPMSENTLNAALRRLGVAPGEHTAHGFRSSASSLLNEDGNWSPDAIEAQLAHADRDVVRGIYNRSPYWSERLRMMQAWADRLDALRAG